MLLCAIRFKDEISLRSGDVIGYQYKIHCFSIIIYDLQRHFSLQDLSICEWKRFIDPIAIPTHSSRNHPIAIPIHSSRNHPIAIPTHSSRNHPIAIPTHSALNHPIAIPTHSSRNHPIAIPTHSARNQMNTRFRYTPL